MATWTQDQMIQMLRGPLRSWYRKRSLDAFPWEGLGCHKRSEQRGKRKRRSSCSRLWQRWLIRMATLILGDASE
jgi:hypothetical protein